MRETDVWPPGVVGEMGEWVIYEDVDPLDVHPVVPEQTVPERGR
ncbi:MAG: hypothetical protein R3C44_12000 [Chloroflexota bacterium]